ncbi:MAG: response regulator [Desulfovibrionaceae bacterium]|nr:response regulator [Desulfovibrionaceae bacterium]MBF0513032.1 response regulator [Desulfovibrionaceae bacterium]
MKVLCILDIDIYRNFLEKYFLSRDIEGVFVTPERSRIHEAIASLAPNLVLMQDSYCEGEASALYAGLRESLDALNVRARIMLLCPAADGTCAKQFEDLMAVTDMVLVTRENIESVFEIFLAERVRGKITRRDVPRPVDRKTILFAETSKTMHRLLTTAFNPARYLVLHAFNGEEALREHRAKSPDIVLTGIQLPRLSGLELCKRIKQENTERYIPVVAFSSSDNPLDIETAFNCGVDDYILKSSAMDQVEAKVNEHLGALERRRRSKILCLDDSKVIRELLRHSFIKNGLHVILAQNGREALEIALRERPEVIVADLGAPGLSGYELFEAIRVRAELENVFLILMCAKEPAAADRKRAERLGVSRFFVKPFEVQRLILAVEQLLSESYRQFKREYDHVLSSMKALVVALEARDRYTSGHTLRVSRMALLIGARLGLSENELHDLEIAASLHDIGKIGVRDVILLKAGKLTEEEYATIKEHALIGAEILRPIKSLKKIIPLIMHHHERWDGAGYPSGIGGEEIPLGSRIIAVADAFDAMTSDRPYRKGMPEHKALGVIGAGAGKQFCPVCAGALLESPARDREAAAGVTGAELAAPATPEARRASG